MSSIGLRFTPQTRGLCRLALLLAIMAGSALAGEIHEAAANGNTAKVQVLLAANPESINSRDADGKTPLHYAAAAGHLSVVELLVTNRANLNVRNKTGLTPFALAKGY